MCEGLEDRTLFSTYTVTNLADGGAGSLRQAILDVNAHAGADTVAFLAGLHGTIPLTSGQLVITGPVSIAGPGASLLSISGDDLSRVFEVVGATTAVSITGLTITKANSGLSFGGGILNYGVLTMANDVISNNVATSLELDGVYGGGGGLMNAGTATVTGTAFEDNTAYAHGNPTSGGNQNNGGGAIYNIGTLTLSGGAVSNNVAQESPSTPQGPANYGGGIYNSGTATITGTSIDGNSSHSAFFGSGGGLYNDGTAIVRGATISGNTVDTSAAGSGGGYGGGVENAGATLTISATTIAGNSAGVSGGGVENDSGTLSLMGAAITGNKASAGAGVFNMATVEIIQTTIANNTAAGSGSLFSGRGGGIVNVPFVPLPGEPLQPATLDLTDSTVSGNTAVNSGGICNYGAATLTDCTINGNLAHDSGGGITTAGGQGMLDLLDSTVSRNVAGSDGGGLDVLFGSPSIANSIIAGNSGATGPDVDGAVSSAGHNLVGQTNGSSGWAGTDLTGTTAHPLNPLLAALGNYGGPTQTMLPLAGSPAINHGSNALVPAGLTTDQRGLPRIVGGTVDIGADEVQTPTPTSGPPQVTHFEVVNGKTGAQLGQLTDGEIVSLSKLHLTSLDMAAFSAPGAVSMTFDLDGRYVGLTNLSLKTLEEADHSNAGLSIGSYTLIVQAFSGKYGTGLKGGFRAVHFTVVK